MNRDALKNYLRKLVKEAIQNQIVESNPLDDFAPGAAGAGHSGDWNEYFDNDREAGIELEKMSIADLKQQGFSPEEIMKIVMGEGKKPVKKILVVKESKQILANEQYVRILEGRKALIESMISEKGIMDKLGGMFGKVNPSMDVDDPAKVAKVVGGSIAKAQKLAKDFSSKSLNTTATINAFHDAVLDALDKWAHLSDTVPEQKAALEKQVIEVARQFYQSLSSQKGRIDSFLKTITADMAKKGFSQSKMTANPRPKKPVAEPVSDLRNKEEVPPMNSIGKAVGDMATNWAK